jgi:hypothetical protein
MVYQLSQDIYYESGDFIWLCGIRCDIETSPVTRDRLEADDGLVHAVITDSLLESFQKE